ncbi:hypothetical protein HAHI6034_01135 [Hathewaya histolytica]|uniref:Uncharacterized protein n=1 Tax=Hathewaya histolytica TaxID=1498 RepID=A0A4U9QY28_HATHI|nr:hypothetical protein [Hathewaya histolytica]VTQ83602.1 Uncharacterised protein [Hathewaya histolytica]
MSYDLKLLVVRPKKLYHTNFESTITVKNEIEDGFRRYRKIWPFMTRAKGVWYSLVEDQNGAFDAYTICDSDFEKDIKDVSMPYWIDDEDIKEDLTPLIIRKKYRTDFEKIVRGLIKTSPERTIMILGSYQSHDKEIVCGTMTFSEYLKLLDEGKILFNVCYIISE